MILWPRSLAALLRGLVEELRLSARLHRSRWEQEQRDRTRD